MAVGMKTCSLVQCDCCCFATAATIFSGYKTVAECFFPKVVIIHTTWYQLAEDRQP